MELKHPIKEAERYLRNAKEILSTKAEKRGNLYTDKKYVKMAGNTAWNGVLYALDATLKMTENKKKNQRLEFNDYKTVLSRRDKKMSGLLQSAYDALHKAMGYDGIQNYKIVQAALADGKEIIVWCEKHYNKN